MTHIVGDATHLKGKPLSGTPASGDTWVYDGTQYIPGVPDFEISGVTTEAYKFIEVDDSTIAADNPSDTLHLSGASGINFMVTSGSGSGADCLLAEVSGLSSGQVPAWSEISGMGSYASGVVADVAGLSGFVMASGAGFAVTVPSPLSGRVLRASGTNPLTDLYWGVDETGSGASGAANSYAFIFVQGSTTLDANGIADTLNISGRSGIFLMGASGALQGEDTIFVEVSGLSSGQIPAWTLISGMASGGSGIASYASGEAGYLAAGLEQLENSLVMIAWDVYSDDRQFSDIATDDFETQSGIDSPASTYWYDASGDYCSHVPVSSGNQTQCNITSEDDVSRKDLKGIIAGWVQDSGAKGHFEGLERVMVGAAVNLSGTVKIPCSGHGFAQSDVVEIRNTASYDGSHTLPAQASGDADNFVITDPNSGFQAETFGSPDEARLRVTLGSGNDNPDIEKGLLVVFAGGTRTIAAISGDGEADQEVELSSSQSGADVTAIYGLDVDATYGLLEVTQHVGNPQTSVTYNLNQDWDTNLANYSIRVVLDANSSSYDGTEVRLTLKAHSATPVAFHHVSIVERSGETAGGTTTPTEVTFPGYDHGVTISGGGSGVSNWIPFTFDASKDYLVTLDFSNDSTDSIFGTGDLYYYRTNFSGWNVQAGTGYATNGAYSVAVNKLEVSTIATPTSLFAGHTENVVRLNTVAWSHIEAVDVTQSNPGSSTIHHAVSFDGRSTWKVFKSSAWRDIVRDNSGTWQYKTGGGAWQNASNNSRLGALKQAFGVTENQMSKSELEAITQAQWQSTGGFNPGTTTTMDLAFGLTAAGNYIPSIDEYSVTYSTSFHDMVLVLESWEASETNPDDAYCVLQLEPVDAITLDTDLKAYVSMDDGSNYEQISGLAVFREIGAHDYVRGDIGGLAPRGDKTMRLKITTHNSKQVRVHAAALGVKYT